jgi:hypothetical protein
VGGAAQDGDWPPAEGLGDDSPDVLERGEVVKSGQPVAAYHPVELGLRLGDEAVAELDAGEEEAGQGAC